MWTVGIGCWWVGVLVSHSRMVVIVESRRCGNLVDGDCGNVWYYGVE